MLPLQVAKALDASGAGEVVVSSQVWQHLAGTGWGSGPVQQGDAEGPPPNGLRLLHWTPDPGGGPGMGCWDDDIDETGGGGFAPEQPSKRPKGASPSAPSHGWVGLLGAGNGGRGMGGAKGVSASPAPVGEPRLGVARRSSYSAGGKVGPAAAAAAAVAAAAPGPLHGLGRAASLDHAAGGVGNAVTPGGRCASFFFSLYVHIVFCGAVASRTCWYSKLYNTAVLHTVDRTEAGGIKNVFFRRVLESKLHAKSTYDV